jgi:hypothetical protein
LLLAIVCAAIACGDDDSSSGGRGGASSSSGGGASSGDPSSSSSSGGGDGTAAQICVDTINAYRKQAGLAPCERWTAAEACADAQAKSDGSTNTGHGAFGKCKELGQNECPGWPGPPETMIPQCLKAMWAEGPGGGHHDLMASTKMKRVACGFAAAPNGRIWAVQDFQ